MTSMEALMNDQDIPVSVKNLITDTMMSDPAALRYVLIMVLTMLKRMMPEVPGFPIPFALLDQTSPEFVSGEGAVLFDVHVKEGLLITHFIPGDRATIQSMVDQSEGKRAEAGLPSIAIVDAPQTDKIQ